MRSLEFPQYKNIDVFKLLYERRRLKVENRRPLYDAVYDAEEEYLKACQTRNFEYHSNVDLPDGLTKETLISLYDRHLRGQAGRDIYNEIVEGPDGTELCCYCSLREAETADHYKEKADFPLLSVFPGNLLPACYACNTKLSGVDFKFHGYFDSVDDAQWLTARIIWDHSFNGSSGFRVR